MENILETVNFPQDLRRLDTEELPQLCTELRKHLINTLSGIGGHFASSLGVVELTVALHHVFETPADKIVWDVGHQAYIHKIITGRREQLPGIRTFGGISGFPRREESDYDSFGVAHAGTSISAASGMLEAFELHSRESKELNQDERFAVAVIGDGGLTSGMAFEALNHSGSLHRKQIVILNDNEMSISPNVGALSLAFSKYLSGSFSTSARRQFKSLLQRNMIPKALYHLLDRMEESAQAFFSTPAMLFAAFGYRYIGPVDGHSMPDLLDALTRAKQQDGPVLVHVATTKGKGYEPAELDSVTYHGVGPFEVETGFFPKKKSTSVNKSYTAVFGDWIAKAVEEDPTIVGITAAMAEGTGLKKLQQQQPDNFYDVGIAEQHAVTFAAGLACEGITPVVAIYSTFLQRAYDQVVHDVCIQSLPVVFAMDRAGLVGADGPTHHGVFDISYLRTLPNMVLMAPKDGRELEQMLDWAVDYKDGPVGIRYPRGNCPDFRMLRMMFAYQLN